MKKIILLFLCVLIFSCKPETNNLDVNKYAEAYKSIDSLASLISKTTPSNDTIFMGFKFGMNKKEYRQRINELKKEGFHIEFIKEFNYLNSTITNSYLIKNDITYSNDNKNYFGKAGFLLVPLFNDNEGMVELTVLSQVDWEGTSPYIEEGWFKARLREEYSNSNKEDRKLGRFITDINYPSDYADWIGKKGNMNILSLTNSHIIFSSDKELLRNVFIKKVEEDVVESNSKKIKF